MSAAIDEGELSSAIPIAVRKAQAERASTLTVLGQMLQRPAVAVGQAVAQRLRWAYAADASDYVLRVDRISAAHARQWRLVHVARPEGGACLLIEDPFNDETLSRARSLVESATPLLIADGSVIDKLLAPGDPADDRNGSGFSGKGVDDVSLPSSDRDAVQALDRVLLDAWDSEASDVHLETTRTGLCVRFRLDGLLVEQGAVDRVPAAQIISRLKVMANLDIAERRVPQDGRFSLSVNGRRVDCRVSIMPSGLGEDAVVRVLDKRRLAGQGESLSLQLLGFGVDMATAIRRLTARPHGMLLVTGPTGSGKTTTLYAALTEMRTGREKVVTIEDPVEYELEGVLQVPVNEKKGLTFARGLRSILRHDPDVIMVGEIRDRETAEIAVQSALTGHQVFTTVHANNALDVVSRFTHMNVDLYGLVAGLNCVLAQRLIRLNCTHCQIEDTEGKALVAELTSGLLEFPQGFTPQKGAGCAACRGTGFRGRTVLGELLVLDDSLRDMLISRAAISDVRDLSKSRTCGSLRLGAVDLVINGRTSADEASRVVGLG